MIYLIYYPPIRYRAMEAPQDQKRLPPHIDQVWLEKLLISARCQEAVARRDTLLREIETLNEPCRDAYMRHRYREIMKMMQ